ncbi:MAG: SurA N-terminal domain-containing protein [Cocleimonas sp.]|nr:SurA N-terminal domain-containing protein [Cocleimonas sp.]
MLQNINDNAKGCVAYGIVGLIVLAFALVGIGSYLDGGASAPAAIVNGEEIPAQQVQSSVLQQRQRLTQMFGGKLPPGFSDNTIKEQALEQIVNATLLRQEAEAGGYRASNQEIYDYLSENPQFQKDGVFDAATYEQVLSSQRRNKSNYESAVRDSISNQQFSQGINKAAFLPTTELTRYQQLQNQTRNVETYTFKKSDFASEIKIADEEIKTYYDKNLTNFKTAEKLKLSYVLLKQDDLANSVEVNDEVLQASYDENADRYVDPEQRKLSHVLIKIDDKDGADAEKKAQEKAQLLYDQLKDGTKVFEDFAVNNSDDSVSAKNGGEIGMIVKGDMGPLFEKAAFALKKGEFSEVVQTEAGFEIIKLLDVVEAKQKTFEEVKAEIEKAYRRDEAEKLFLENSDKMQTLAFESEGSLDSVADAVGLKVETSDWVERGAAPTPKSLFSSPKILSTVFSDDVLKQGKNSELIEIDASSVAIIRLKEHKLPEQKPQSDVSDEIKVSLADQKLRKLLIEKGEKALKAIQASGEWPAVETVGGKADKVEKVADLKRTDRKLPPVLVGKVFSMQKPQEDKKTFDNAILPEGDYVLIGLLDVKDGKAELDTALQQRFTQSLSARESTALLKALREKAEVTLFPENLQ